MDVGVIIGRFQVDELHRGHKALISFVGSRHPNVIIFLGIAPFEGTPSNPLSYQLREQMIRSFAPEATILPLYDVFSDDEWSKNLDNTIKKLYFGSTVTLYCGDDGFKPSYKGEFEVVVEQRETRVESGTDIRTKIGNSPDHQAAFRAGIIHQTQKPYLNTKMCVDIAIVKDGKVLLGRKKGEPGWRFPGGQIDPTDDSLEFAAKRELYEETSLTCEGSIIYLESFLIGDWRNVGTGMGIFTALFLATGIMGSPRAKDDLDEVKWFSLDTINYGLVVSEHVPLFRSLLENTLMPKGQKGLNDESNLPD